MSRFEIVHMDKHTAIVFDEKADRTFVAAVGPVQRLQVLAEIQDDPRCNIFDLGISFVIQRHINSKTGFAKIKQKTIANESGVGLRTVERRLKELDDDHGHIAQIRQGPGASLFFLVMKEPPADTVLEDHKNRHRDGSDEAPSDLSEDQRTASQDIKNRLSRHKEPPMDANALYIELSDLTQRENSAAPSRRPSASSAPADTAPSPRELSSVAQYPARENLKDPSHTLAGSLASASARSPAEGDSENGVVTPLAGEEIPRADPETRNGAASLMARDDGGDPSFEDDWTDPDDERLLAKERREEERDARLAEERAYREIENLDDDVDF